MNDRVSTFNRFLDGQRIHKVALTNNNAVRKADLCVTHDGDDVNTFPTQPFDEVTSQ